MLYELNEYERNYIIYTRLLYNLRCNVCGKKHEKSILFDETMID